jgi:uncharacterized membrane protein YeaQ/YmgE (transglycosylase-associated protein family)
VVDTLQARLDPPRGAASREPARHGSCSLIKSGGVQLMGILGWILFGLVVGILAKIVMPGRDPGGIIVTILLGIVGAIVGGFMGRALGFYGPNEPAGFLMSFLGAVLLLALYRMLFRRRAV